MKLIEPIIGKSAYMGGYEVQPQPDDAQRAAKLKALMQRSSGVVGVRIRPEFKAGRMLSEIAAATSSAKATLMTEGLVRAAGVREFDPETNRMTYPNIITVHEDEVAHLGISQALLLLDRHPYGYIFEEVDLKQTAKVAATPAAALANASADNAAALKEIADLKAKLAAEKQARVHAEILLAAKTGSDGDVAAQGENSGVSGEPEFDETKAEAKAPEPTPAPEPTKKTLPKPGK